MAPLAQAQKNLMVIVFGGMEVIQDTSVARFKAHRLPRREAPNRIVQGCQHIYRGRFTLASPRVNSCGARFALGSI